MEKRENQRVEMDGLYVDISDGIGFYPGVVSDVSKFGLRITDLPKRISDKTRKMTVVVGGHGRNFKMLITPRWTAEKGLRKIVGAEILNTPWEWTEFVMKFETHDDDVWEVINL